MRVSVTNGVLGIGKDKLEVVVGEIGFIYFCWNKERIKGE